MAYSLKKIQAATRHARAHALRHVRMAAREAKRGKLAKHSAEKLQRAVELISTIGTVSDKKQAQAALYKAEVALSRNPRKRKTMGFRISPGHAARTRLARLRRQRKSPFYYSIEASSGGHTFSGSFGTKAEAAKEARALSKELGVAWRVVKKSKRGVAGTFSVPKRRKSSKKRSSKKRTSKRRTSRNGWRRRYSKSLKGRRSSRRKRMTTRKNRRTSRRR